MGSKKKYRDLLRRNKKFVAGLAALMMCCGAFLASGRLLPDKTVNGDVLVDSLNVDDENDASNKKSSKNKEAKLVASDDVAQLENKDSYFQELRANLDMDRNKIISMLTDAEDSASTKKEKQEAAAQKMRLLDYMEKEKTVETLIKNKGLPESFVVISDSGVNVTVNTEDLDQQTVTKICEIVMRQTGVKASEIVVQDVSK